MMNRGYFKPSFKRVIKNLFMPDEIMYFLKIMRNVDYYSNKKGIKYLIYRMLYRRVGRRLGFSIGCNVFGYGLIIPHYGTIVVGNSNRIGNYAVLHTSTCISDNGKKIGDAFYLATGAKMTSKIIIGDNVSVGANSVVNKSFPEGNVMIAGAPARIIKDDVPWYIRDGEQYKSKVEAVEYLRHKMNL